MNVSDVCLKSTCGEAGLASVLCGPLQFTLCPHGISSSAVFVLANEVIPFLQFCFIAMPSLESTCKCLTCRHTV